MMNIKFHVLPMGKILSLNVSPSETIRDLKEKVKNYQGIAIHRQSLYYTGLDLQLQDEWTVSHCNLDPGSCVLVQVKDEHPPPPVSHSHLLPQTLPPQPSPSHMVPNPLPPPPSTVTLNVKVPRSQDRIPFEVDKDETILHLKVKIAACQDMGGVPVERIVLQSPCVEWHDDQVLQNILSSESVDVDVILKLLAAATSSSSSSRLAQP